MSLLGYISSKLLEFWGGKGKDRVTIIKGLFNERVEEALEVCTIKDLK